MAVFSFPYAKGDVLKAMAARASHLLGGKSTYFFVWRSNFSALLQSKSSYQVTPYFPLDF